MDDQGRLKAEYYYEDYEREDIFAHDIKFYDPETGKEIEIEDYANVNDEQKEFMIEALEAFGVECKDYLGAYGRVPNDGKIVGIERERKLAELVSLYCATNGKKNNFKAAELVILADFLNGNVDNIYELIARSEKGEEALADVHLGLLSQDRLDTLKKMEELMKGKEHSVEEILELNVREGEVKGIIEETVTGIGQDKEETKKQDGQEFDDDNGVK